MTVRLEFNLPEEYDEFMAAAQGGRLSAALFDMDQYLRSQMKYHELPEEVDVALDTARRKLWEIMEDWGVSSIVDR